MQVLAFPGSNLQDSKEAHREKSLAHSLFHFSPSFSVVICMDRKLVAGYASTSTIYSLEDNGASRCETMNLPTLSLSTERALLVFRINQWENWLVT